MKGSGLPTPVFDWPPGNRFRESPGTGANPWRKTMADTHPFPESLEDFKNSFFYGSRSDLAFKFLKNLPADEVGEFFRALLEKLGQTIDDGDADRLVQHAYVWQARA
jgi:hypothetical protein